jgi:DNA-binding XRE family transcriptional regulator
LLVESFNFGNGGGMDQDITHLTTADGQALVLLPLAVYESLSVRAGVGVSERKALFGLPPTRVAGDIANGPSPLALWRRHRGLSQLELSMLSGISRHTIMRMEARGKGAGSQASRRQLAAALDIEIGEI